MWNRADDPFCEEKFFIEWMGGATAVKNPTSVATGFVMFLAPFLLNNVFVLANTSDMVLTDKKKKLPLPLIFAKAGLSLTGLGTMYFHSVCAYEAEHVFHVDFETCNWVPIVLMCGFILGFYLMMLFSRFNNGYSN